MTVTSDVVFLSTDSILTRRNLQPFGSVREMILPPPMYNCMPARPVAPQAQECENGLSTGDCECDCLVFYV